MLKNIEFLSEHPVYKLHEIVSYFFANLHNTKTFDASIFKTNYSDFIEVLDDSKKLTRLFCEFVLQVGPYSQVLSDAFIHNNCVMELCEDETQSVTLMSSFPKELATSIYNLFSCLFSETLHQSAFVRTYGSIIDHYKIYKERNGRLCPFCLLELLPSPNVKRACYDHYLSISDFPLSGVNFKNLVPICDSCNNSPSKGAKPVIFSNPSFSNRRIAYYPYSKCHGIEISIDCHDFFGEDQSFSIIYSCKNPNEESKKNTWLDVFDIEKRNISDLIDFHETFIRDMIICTLEVNPDSTQQLITFAEKHLRKLKQKDERERLHIEIAFWDFIIRNSSLAWLLLYYINEHYEYVKLP